MNQPKISTGFAVSVVFTVAVFFGWMVWITGKVVELESSLVETNQERYAEFGLKKEEKLRQVPDQGGVACTMEAKLCPDGKTFVSRTGPKCEFSACPK